MTLLENLQHDIDHFLSDDSATVPLLKQVLLFLGNGEFIQADAYCDKALDIDPENSLAYLYKLMASRRIQSLQELADSQYSIDTENSYKKCVRFAPEAMKQHLHALNMHICTNCIAANQKRARIHMTRGEWKETAQLYHAAMTIWEGSKETLPNAQAIYSDLANEVADFNWKLMLHDRQCPDDRELIVRAIPLENDRWYQSAYKWAGEAKRAYFSSVAKETLFNAHLKCMEAIGNMQRKSAELWAERYQAAAPADDPLPEVHNALVPTNGYTVFVPDAVKAMLDLIRLYSSIYPQGVDGVKTLLKDYYRNIFQSFADFSGESANEVITIVREITNQMANAVSEDLSPYDMVSTYLVAANALTIRYSNADGVITNADLFHLICGYYEAAAEHAPSDQSEEIRKDFNDFLIETAQLPSSNVEIAAEASACMDGSILPYQLYLSRLVNNYSVDEEQLIPQQLTDELARWRQLIESADPKKGCYWLCDQQSSILATFEAAEKAAETCKQYPSTLQTTLETSYTAVIKRAGVGNQEELAAGWSQQMDALQVYCNERADMLARELALTRELNDAKLTIAQKYMKHKDALQLTRGIISLLAILLLSFIFSAVSIPAVGFGWYCAKSPEASEEYKQVLFYCINIGLPALAGCLCLINCWAIRHYSNHHIRKAMWLFAIFSVLSYLAMAAVSNRLLLDPQFTVIAQNLTAISTTGVCLILCGIVRTLLDGTFYNLAQRARSRATKSTCKIGTLVALILLLRQALECFLVAGLFAFALITG